ncbi:MAG TPA: kelch repeat-containing protein [Actinomycetes bacterium]|nr:kelch repeat-containing protein [Actinomycetes bacterium]
MGTKHAALVLLLSIATARSQTAPRWVDVSGVTMTGTVVAGSPLPLRVIDDTFLWHLVEWTGDRFEANTGSGYHLDGARAAVYDPGAQRVVALTVDAYAATPYASTHIFDGAAWTQPTTTLGGAIGGTPILAFDPMSQSVLAYSQSYVFNTEIGAGTWRLVGSTWQQVNLWYTTNPLGPSVREHSAMATAPNGAGVVLFGGRRFSTNYGDTWLWNGTAWAKALPPTAPSPRHGHTMALDPHTDRTMLYGDGMGVLGDVWLWDGATWTPGLAPPVPALHEAQLVASGGSLFLHGTDGAVSARHYLVEWTGNAWVVRLTRDVPAYRYANGWAVDDVNHRIVMFGGSRFEGYAGTTPIWTVFGDTWVFGTEWTQVAGGPSPPPRDDVAMTWDAQRQQAVLFGGSSSNDTWTWDGAMWSQHVTAVAPSARHKAAMAYDPQRHTVVLYGGYQGYTVFTDTWEWDGAHWSPVPTATHPVTGDPQIAYDDARGVLALDVLTVVSTSVHATSMWELQNGDWVFVNAPPPGRFAYDPREQALTVGATHVYRNSAWQLRSHAGDFGDLLSDRGRSRLLNVGPAFSIYYATDEYAAAENYGTGCGPSLPTTMSFNHRPRLGSEPRADVACHATNAPTWLFAGLQKAATTWVPGCTIYVDAVVLTVPGGSDANGWASFELAVPPVPTLIGLELFCQAVTAHPLGLGLSNGVRVRLGL